MTIQKQTALTGIQKDYIERWCYNKTVKQMEDKAIECFEGGFPEMGRYVQNLIAQRPDHRCVGQPDAPPKQRTTAPPPVIQERETAPWLTPDRAKALVLSGGILAGGGYLMAAIVFPALVAVVSFIYSNALLIGGGIATAIVLLSLRGGEKKTEVERAAQPQNFAPPEGWACMEQTQRIWFPKK